MAPAPASVSHPHHQPSSYEYLDALLTVIPNDTIPPEITVIQSQGNAQSSPYSRFIDTALRLASGGPARPDDAPHIRDTWHEIQTSLQVALHALHHPTTESSKRKHSSPPPSSKSTINNKKSKYEDAGDDDDDDKDDDDDVPQLTLHAISATAPVRHKVDITLHARTLRLAHSTTGASTARCTRTALTRVFLLPTRARSSGAHQWTALLLAGDKPAPPAPRRGAGAGGKEAKVAAVRFELACSVPDSSNPSTIPRMTVHTPTPTSSSAPITSQVTNAHEAVSRLLSFTISGTSVALTTVERGVPLAGITAFRGVRETLLWFFDNSAGAGILADGRPAEFWALKDLARGEAGVRLRSATGRTCSVVLMRRSGDDGTGEDEEEEEEGEETEFQMIDGKERDRILEWVRRHRGAFGITEIVQAQTQTQAASSSRGVTNGKDKETEKEKEKDGGEDLDSDSDSDFEASVGESDDGSPSSNSSGSDEGEDGSAGNESGGDEEEDEDEEDKDVAMMELDNPDPKHHPLLRAGALPKMSRAAMDAAVELVMGDLVGQGSSTGSGSESLGQGRSAREGAVTIAGTGDDDEEDELED